MGKTRDGSQAAEDRLLEGLLDQLGDHVLPSTASIGEDSEAVLREYTELVGLLAYGLEPLTPSAPLRQRLGAAAASGSGSAAEPELAEVARIPSSPWRRWALPVAASLAAALLGYSGWQLVRLERQSTTIEQFADRLSRADRQVAELVEFRRQLQQAESKLSLVTSKGVEVCTLYPPEADAGTTVPRGTLFVAADHQHWYMRIEGLEPCPQGQAYQLWFIRSDGSAASGGLLDVEPGVGLEVTSETMPAGTVAVSITLEPAGGSSQPSGPSVLYGDEVMRIL